MAAQLSLSIVLFTYLLIAVKSYREAVHLPRAQAGEAGNQSVTELSGFTSQSQACSLQNTNAVYLFPSILNEDVRANTFRCGLLMASHGELYGV